MFENLRAARSRVEIGVEDGRVGLLVSRQLANRLNWHAGLLVCLLCGKEDNAGQARLVVGDDLFGATRLLDHRDGLMAWYDIEDAATLDPPPVHPRTAVGAAFAQGVGWISEYPDGVQMMVPWWPGFASATHERPVDHLGGIATDIAKLATEESPLPLRKPPSEDTSHRTHERRGIIERRQPMNFLAHRGKDHNPNWAGSDRRMTDRDRRITKPAADAADQARRVLDQWDEAETGVKVKHVASPNQVVEFLRDRGRSASITDKPGKASVKGKPAPRILTPYLEGQQVTMADLYAEANELRAASGAPAWEPPA